MPPLIQEMLMSLVRKGLVLVGAWLISHGVFGEDEWASYAAGLAVIIVGAGWSLWVKYRDRLSFLAARALPSGASTEAIVDLTNSPTIQRQAFQ